MNLVDRAITAIAPQIAAKRALARAQLGAIERSGLSGRKQRFRDPTGRFELNTADPDDARPKRFVDRATIMRLAYENPFGRKAISALVNNAVGWGISGTPAAPKKVVELWKAWTAKSDLRGRLNLFGQQELAVRTMFREGEVFIARHLVRDGGAVPLRLQLLDAGMLATDKTGADIEGGIEYDAEGGIVAYWFKRARDHYRRGRAPVRYDAKDVIHLFVQEEAGQKRGRSIFEAVIKRLGDIDDTLDADLVRRKIESCFVGFRALSAEADERPIGERQERGEGLAPSEYFEPGTIVNLDQGEEITFADPKPAGGLNDALRIQLLATAAGFGITYEHMTGDLSQVNFSSYRAGALEFDASIARIQWNTLIPVMLERIWEWFCQAAFEFGAASKPSYPIRWSPPPRKSIDRKGDAEADVLEMQAGLENRRSLLNARGEDHDAFLEETAADLAKQKTLGLNFRGDPFSQAQFAGEPSGATNAATE